MTEPDTGVASDQAQDAPQSRAILHLATFIIREQSVADLVVLSDVAAAFDESRQVRQRMTSALLLDWQRRQSAVSFDDRLGGRMLQLTLLVLNGVATGAIDPAASLTGIAGYWRRFRLVRRLIRRRPADGVNTPLPMIANTTGIAETVRWIAAREGLEPPAVEKFTSLVEAVLSGGSASAST